MSGGDSPTGERARRVAALAFAAISARILVDAALGGRPLHLAIRAIALPLFQPALVLREPAWGLVVLVELGAWAVAIRADGWPGLGAGGRDRLGDLAREAFCLAYSLALAPVGLLYLSTPLIWAVPAWVVLLYLAHGLPGSRGEAPARRAARALASVAAGAQVLLVCAVLGGIAPSLGVLTLATSVAAVAHLHRRRSGGGAAGPLVLTWTAGACLVVFADNWAMVAAMALGTLFVRAAGFLTPAPARRLAPAFLVLLLCTNVLQARGLGLVMGRGGADRWLLERQDGVEVLLPFRATGQRYLGEHLTWVTPSCDGRSLLVGSASPSRWVLGLGMGRAPRLIRTDLAGEVLAVGEDVLEPAYRTALDCERGRALVGNVMGRDVALVDLESLAVVARRELHCDGHLSTVTGLPAEDAYLASCSSTYVLAPGDLETLEVLEGRTVFDAASDGTVRTLTSGDGVRRWGGAGDGRLSPRTLLDSTAVRDGLVVSRPGGVALLGAPDLVPQADRRLGVWLRYLAADPGGRYVAASDYVAGRVHLLRASDLLPLGSWQVGDRPRRASFAPDLGALYVGTSAGLVRVSLTGLLGDEVGSTRGEHPGEA